MTNRKIIDTLAYFQPPDNYFWQWSENMEVLEWVDGKTICYREDLMPLLSELSIDGVPSLGTVLLIVAACKDNWTEERAGRGILAGLLKQLPGEADWQITHGFLAHLTEFMDIICSLPRELRRGRNRVHLIREVCELMPNKLIVNQSKFVIEEFRSGRLDDLAVPRHQGALLKALEQDVENLTSAYGQFPTREKLEMVLRTGLKKLPGVIDDELPETPELDLLAALAQDQETMGLARLTRRLLAAVRIPIQTSGSSDMPIGGVSDLTNRGELDRLLLSELAHDDLTLTARLVNNEALYLRREEPPQDPIQQRVILLDATLRMWGVPRVFAMASALACSRNNPHKAEIVTHILGGTKKMLADLSTKKGVVHGLEQLDPALHCGEALKAFCKNREPEEHTETVLITCGGNLQDTGFSQILSHCTDALQYLIVVSRSGQLQLFRMVNGRRKLLTQATYNLQQLLNERPDEPHTTSQPDGPPAFFQNKPPPMYFPTSRFRPTAYNCTPIYNNSLLGVTDDQRLLFWESRAHGAREVLAFIEPGSYCFGIADSTRFCIMVTMARQKQLKLYVLENFELVKDVIIDYPRKQYTDPKMAFYKGSFYLNMDGYLYEINAETGAIQPKQEEQYLKTLLNEGRGHPGLVRNFKKLINSGYNVWTNISRIYVNEQRLLCLDGRAIMLTPEQALKILPKAKKDQEQAVRYFEAVNQPLVTQNSFLKFSFVRWSNAVEAIIDFRGLLHLRTMDHSLPEVTMTLVLNKQLSGWTSDGRTFGSPYFLKVEGEKSNSPQIYHQYLTGYIKKILENAQTP